MANKPKPDYKTSKYKDGRAQGVSAAGGTGRSIKDRKDKMYGSEKDQSRQAAFRAAVALKSNKKPAYKVGMNKKGK